MNNSEDGVYNPLEVEAAIDDAYAMTELLDQCQESAEQAINAVEKFPYAIHAEEPLEPQIIEQAFEGIAELGLLTMRPEQEVSADDIVSEIGEYEHLKPYDKKGMTEQMQKAKGYSSIMDEIGRTLLEEVLEPAARKYSEIETGITHAEDLRPGEIIDLVGIDDQKEPLTMSALLKFDSDTEEIF